MDKKKIVSVAGTVAVAASAVALIGIKRRIDLYRFMRSYKSTTGELVTAFTLTTAGAALAMVANQLNEERYPNRAEKLQKADDKLTELSTPKKN